MYNLSADPNQQMWGICEGFKHDINFAIWLLEQDGMHVSPFDQHSDGDRCLRDRGMTEEIWRSWFTKLVLLSDHRLHWNEPEPRQWIEPWIRSTFKAQFEQIQVLQRQHYQQAYTAAKQVWSHALPEDWMPVDFLEANSELQELVREQWERYVEGGCVREGQAAILSDDQFADSGEDQFGDSAIDLWNLLKPYHSRIMSLELHLVAYVTPVSYVVPPVSVVLSINSARPHRSDRFIEDLVAAVEDLASQSTQ